MSIGTFNGYFEHIDGILWVYMRAIKEAGLSVGYYQRLNSQGSDKTRLHPKNKKVILVRYDAISEANQQKIIDRFGSHPADFIARQPIRSMIIPTSAANQFFLSYRYADNKMLPIHRVKQYSRACDILEMIKRIDESRNRLIKDLGISVPSFYDHLEAIINEEKKHGESDTYEGANQLHARFPASYMKLRAKVDAYKKEGFACVMEKNLGNANNLKVATDEARDFLLQLIKDGRQFSDVMVALMYNTKANENGWKPITPPTVQKWRKDNEAEITPYRYGNSAYNERFIKQVPGMRPSAPLYLVEHDDNNLDLLFQGPDGSQYNRYVAIVVSDSHCDLVLGKSVIMADTPETWQVQHAYIDAMYYIRSLTGQWYMPIEIKADKWRSKALTPFYNKLARHVPPAHGNKHRGYIEQLFGSELWKNGLKLVSNGNYNGNNISAKFRGFNPDTLDLSLRDKSRPMIGDEAEMQIEQFFYLLRNMPDVKRTDMNALCKEQKWLEAWNRMTPEQRNPITDEQFLLTFGITHTPRHKDTIRITNRGVEPQIENVKYSYELPELWMYNKLRGADVQVIYDPYDMSRVLVTNHDDIRFVAKSNELVPRALKDHYTGSRTYLNALLAEKKDMVKEVATKHQGRMSTSLNYAEAMLQSGSVLPKEVKNSAERKQLEKFEEDREKYLDNNHDFSQYL